MNLLHFLRHLLLPHHSNNHKARLLHPSVLSLLAAVFLVYQFAINFYVLLSPAVLGFASDISPIKVVELTNQKRAEQGLAPLVVNSKLNEAAQRKAGDMFAFNYWAHTSPSGRSPWDFFSEVGYKYVYAGENLARDFNNSESVVEAWMNSPSHKDNLLSPKYKEIGLSVVNGTINGVETTLVVQLFGTPTSATTVKKEVSQIAVAQAKTPTAQKTQPASIPSQIKSESQALEENSGPVLLSPFLLTKVIAIFLLGIVLGALVLDLILVYQRKIIRLSGKNIAHLIFVGALLLAVIITTPGIIL